MSFAIRIYKKRFALSLTFILGIEHFIASCISFLGELMYVESYFWMAFAFSAFGILSATSMPNLDQTKNSIFTPTKEKDPELQITFQTIGSTFLFLVAHGVILMSFYVGVFLMPVFFGGHLWNYYYNGNSTDPTSLRFMIQILNSSSAYLFPAVGAYLELDIKKIVMGTKPEDQTWAKRLLKIFTSYHRHTICLFFGLIGCIVSTFLIYFGSIYPDSSYYYFISVLFGISVCLLKSTIVISPILMILNLRSHHVGITYILYYVLILLVQYISEFISGYAVSTEFSFTIVWSICLSILSAVVVLLLVIYIPYFIARYIKKNFTINTDPSMQFDIDKRSSLNASKLDLFGTARPKMKKINIFERIRDFVIELFLFIFAVVLFGITTGIFNMILQFGWSNTKDYSWIKSFYLLIIFIIAAISLRLGFPTYLRKFLNLIFFKKTRKALGLYTRSTVADTIDSNPHLTLATLVLKGDATLWKILLTAKIERKPLIFVVPDDVVLKSEEDRVLIREYDETFDYSALDCRRCENGMIVINEKVIRERSIYNFASRLKEDFLRNKFKGRFINLKGMVSKYHMYTFLCYSFFSVIPNFYRVFYKLYCPTCDPAIYEDGVSFLIRIINFVFGFFIFMPFITLWKEIAKYLERYVSVVLIAKKEFFTTFKWDKTSDYERLTMQQVLKNDALYKHVEALTWSKAEHIKYVFIFGVIFVKIVTITFSTIMLFVTSFPLTNEIIQIYFLVIILEIAILRYILQPAAFATTEFNILGMSWESKCNQYSLNMMTDCGRSPETLKRMEQIRNLMMTAKNHWTDLVISGWGGFYLKSKTLQTGWMINGAFFRGWLETDLFSVVPALLVYFLRKFLNVF